MTAGGPPAPVPLFIDANGRRLFALHHPAAVTGTTRPRGAVVMLAPFAEEMNMSRRMAYLLGRALAGAGYDFLLPDLTGTGESDGDFVDARWELWREDAQAALDWLATASGATPVPLGLRAGALLAASLGDVPRLLLWQPVGNGETMINQFLRIRVAAGLTGGDKETTKGLRDKWAAGETVEVAGYELHAALAAAIDGLRLADLAPPAGTRVDWLEIGDPETGPGPASQRTIETWQAEGADVRAAAIRGEPFWAIQETTVVPALIEATLAALEAA